MSSADKARVGPAADGPAPPEEDEGEGGGEAGGKGPAAEAAPGPSAAFRFLVTRREPAVRLQYAVSGLEPLAWSEDHRVSVSTARSIAVLELICDVHNPGQDLVIHRTSVPAPLNSCLLKVSPPGAPALGSPLAPSRSGVTRPPRLFRGFPSSVQSLGLSGRGRRLLGRKQKRGSRWRPVLQIALPLAMRTGIPGAPVAASSFLRPGACPTAGAEDSPRCFLRLHPL